MAETNENAEKSTEGFLKIASQYKEFILLVAGLVSAVFFVRDYFATKQEVRVLQCQAQNGLALVESRVQAEALKKNILSIQHDIDDLVEKKKRLSGQALKSTADSIAALNLDLRNATADLNDEHTSQSKAIENLKPGVCDNEVSKK